MPKVRLYFGSRGGVYYRKGGRKVYVRNQFGDWDPYHPLDWRDQIQDLGVGGVVRVTKYKGNDVEQDYTFEIRRTRLYELYFKPYYDDEYQEILITGKWNPDSIIRYIENFQV